jgi:hypothetical protein
MWFLHLGKKKTLQLELAPLTHHPLFFVLEPSRWMSLNSRPSMPHGMHFSFPSLCSHLNIPTHPKPTRPPTYLNLPFSCLPFPSCCVATIIDNLWPPIGLFALPQPPRTLVPLALQPPTTPFTYVAPMYALVLVSLLQAMSSKLAIMFLGCFVYLQQATSCMPIAPSSLLLFCPFILF